MWKQKFGCVAVVADVAAMFIILLFLSSEGCLLFLLFLEGHLVLAVDVDAAVDADADADVAAFCCCRCHCCCVVVIAVVVVVVVAVVIFHQYFQQ